MKSLWVWVVKILINAHYFLLVGTIIYIIFQPILDTLIPKLEIKTLFSILSVIFVTFALHFDKKLENIRVLNQSISNKSIEKAIIEGAKKLNNTIGNMDVFALTTAVIHPIIRSGDFSIGRCRVMLYKFSDTSRIENSEELSKHNELIVKKWIDLKKTGKIRELEIVQYEDTPMDFLINLDNQILIKGYYFYKDNSPHGNLYEEPVLISADNIETQKFIIKSSKRFDNMWNYWKEKNAN